MQGKHHLFEEDGLTVAALANGCEVLDIVLVPDPNWGNKIFSSELVDSLQSTDLIFNEQRKAVIPYAIGRKHM